MSSMGAVAVWGPISKGSTGQVSGGGPRGAEAPPAEVRLTRRGRLARSAVVALLLVASSLLLMGRLVGEPVRADVSAGLAPVVTHSVVVEQGDSLWNIAQRLAPSQDPREVVHEIRQLNGLRSNLIQPGQVLLVPSVG